MNNNTSGFQIRKSFRKRIKFSKPSLAPPSFFQVYTPTRSTQHTQPEPRSNSVFGRFQLLVNLLLLPEFFPGIHPYTVYTAYTATEAVETSVFGRFSFL